MPSVSSTYFPWQMALWQQLQQRHLAQRLPHALLLTGASGLGKLQLAQRFAQSLLCQHPIPASGEPCTTCRSCQLLHAGSHPDYRLLRPEEEDKPIKVDQVRELCTFLGYTPQYGGYKVAVLEPAERMNLNAANSLLKTLEEPPGTCLIMLVSSDPVRLPITVRSRCQTLTLATPNADVALTWLRQQLPDQQGELANMLGAAAGAPLSALRYAQDQPRWQRRRTLAESYAQVSSGRLNPLSAAQLWAQGASLENLGWLVSWQVDAIRLKMNPHPPHLNNPDLRELLRAVAQRHPPQHLFARLDSALQMYRLCSTTQVRADILVESFLSAAAPA